MFWLAWALNVIKHLHSWKMFAERAKKFRILEEGKKVTHIMSCGSQPRALIVSSSVVGAYTKGNNLKRWKKLAKPKEGLHKESYVLNHRILCVVVTLFVFKSNILKKEYNWNLNSPQIFGLQIFFSLLHT